MPHALFSFGHRPLARACVFALALAPTVAVIAQADTTERVFDAAAVHPLPEFSGGIEEMYNWMAKHQHYPDSAYRHGIQGKVYVQFTIGKTGAIEEAHVLRAADPSLDAEALRLVRTMPPWSPGYIEGKPVRCRYNLPIVFKLGKSGR